MSVQDCKAAGADALRDLAVRAVMRSGRFETSGPVRLAVLRRSGLMIAYHTPFNPLPALSSEMKYLAVCAGKAAHLQRYGIHIWHQGMGKVFCAGWSANGDLIVDLYVQGDWEELFEKVVTRALQSRSRGGRVAVSARRPTPTPMPLPRNPRRAAKRPTG